MLINSRNTTTNRSAAAPFVLTFFIMFFFWVLFSGKFDLFHISLGVASSAIIAALSKDLLFPSGIGSGFIICWLRFAGYVPWLFYQILLANLRILYLVFHPRMMELIDPQIITLRGRAFAPAEPTGANGDVEWVQPAVAAEALTTQITGFASSEGTVSLTDANTIVGVAERSGFHDALRLTLVKEEKDLDTFDRLFPLFFGTEAPPTLDALGEMGEEDIKGAQTHVNMTFSLGPIVRKSGKFYSTE